MALGSTIAGTWYPGTEREIRALAKKWETAFGEAPSGEKPNVLVLPHAGWAYSGETAWTAVRTVCGAKFRRVVVLAPSHRAWIENRLVAPESDAVSTPLGEIKIDRDWVGGDFNAVCRTISLLHEAGCHVEVTTLIVPGRNDADADIDAIADFVASVSPDIPLHVTRFFPRWRMSDASPTPVATVRRLADLARRRLSRVLVGNC